ncbi:MAG TPA: IS4 family transposase [Terriglobia bacterium]|nr:IS4 family transposase [Terriglobia bacterium]
MRAALYGRFSRQVYFLKQQFLQEGRLPFTEVLPAECFTQVLEKIELCWNDCIYMPLVTLWVFLGQVLSADHSCRAAVARLIAHRVSQGLRACSSETGAYCQARKRLPEQFFSAVACLVGRKLDAQVDAQWLWQGRRVYLFDGSTVSMPDTPENRKAYPLTYNQRPGTAFPIARIGAIISLACGAILNLGICRYAGKGQGEVSLLRQLWDVLRSGDVLLTDCLMSNWTTIAMLKQRGVETVSRLNKAVRSADFRQGIRLGKDHHLVRWFKPTSIRSVDRETYRSLPAFITIRETRIRVEQPGFRTKSIVVVTTLLDPEQTTKEDLATLYRARWNNELDLRSIKITLQMDMLRCKTPELVRKEIWTHVLAYNLIRTLMAQAASQSGIPPRSISFKATLQVLEAFQPLIAYQAHRGFRHREALYRQVLQAIAVHRVADRPDRFEPRMTKRKPKNYDRLTRPRKEIKRQIFKRFRKT